MECLNGFGVGKDFLNRTQKSLSTMEKIYKLGFINILDVRFITRHH